MNEILKKISSYNLLNYLLPGILFTFFLDKMSYDSFSDENIANVLFVSYFVGLVISRVGSLFLEPFLKKIKFLKFSNYKSFVLVSKKDSKIEIFSETNNMYRTFCSMFLILIIFKIYLIAESFCCFLQIWNMEILILLLFFLFLFSYRKQTQYITKRVSLNKDGELH